MTRECRPSQCLYLLLVRAGKGLVVLLFLFFFSFGKDRANYRKAQITAVWPAGSPHASSGSSQGCVDTCSPSAPSFRATPGVAVVFDPTEL